MEENFVGYLLNALDPDTHRQVEDHLRACPEARHHVELLRGALEPLRADAEEIEPPPGLAVRALARVAEYCCRDLPRVPTPPRRQEVISRGWWRRADVLVAACLFLAVSLLVPPVVYHVRQQSRIEACKANLREVGGALISYSDAHHGAFPNVADPRLPHHAAGIFMPELIQDRQNRDLPSESLSIRCPGNGPPVPCPWTMQELRVKSEQDFQPMAPRLVTCYAYSLGYRGEDGQVHGLVHAGFPVPIVADRAPRGEEGAVGQGNSPNHGGRGQNVLFTDGHVEFCTSRYLAGDDIFLNRRNQVAAGTDARDVVLGPSEAQP